MVRRSVPAAILLSTTSVTSSHPAVGSWRGIGKQVSDPPTRLGLAPLPLPTAHGELSRTPIRLYGTQPHGQVGPVQDMRRHGWDGIEVIAEKIQEKRDR